MACAGDGDGEEAKANRGGEGQTQKHTQIHTNTHMEHMQGTTHRGQCLEEIGCRDKLSGRGRIE
jgi:hypothetical protein